MTSATSLNNSSWPTAKLDPISRLHVLAGGLPGTVVHERTIDAPFDHVWSFVEDLQRSVPSFERTVARLTIVHHDGNHLKTRGRGTWRGGFLPLGFDVDLEPGWCLMVSRPRFYVVGMAAEPDGERTRWGQLEGLSTRGRVLSPLL